MAVIANAVKQSVRLLAEAFKLILIDYQEFRFLVFKLLFINPTDWFNETPIRASQ
jgi:predicted ATP-grasp superfamily ATP-dependent carboligase